MSTASAASALAHFLTFAALWETRARALRAEAARLRKIAAKRLAARSSRRSIAGRPKRATVRVRTGGESAVAARTSVVRGPVAEPAPAPMTAAEVEPARAPVPEEAVAPVPVVVVTHEAATVEPIPLAVDPAAAPVEEVAAPVEAPAVQAMADSSPIPIPVSDPVPAPEPQPVEAPA